MLVGVPASHRLAAFGIDLIPFIAMRSAILLATSGTFEALWLMTSDLAFVAYRGLGNRSAGRYSIGKRIVGLDVLDTASRKRPSLRQAGFRESPLLAYMVLSLPLTFAATTPEPPGTFELVLTAVALTVGVLWLMAELRSLSRTGRSLHDRLARTVVVRRTVFEASS